MTTKGTGKWVAARHLRPGDYIVAPASLSPCVVCAPMASDNKGERIVCSMNGNRHAAPFDFIVFKLDRSIAKTIVNGSIALSANLRNSTAFKNYPTP